MFNFMSLVLENKAAADEPEFTDISRGRSF